MYSRYLTKGYFLVPSAAINSVWYYHHKKEAYKNKVEYMDAVTMTFISLCAGATLPHTVAITVVFTPLLTPVVAATYAINEILNTIKLK